VLGAQAKAQGWDAISEIAAQGEKARPPKGICQYGRLETGNSLHYHAGRTQNRLLSAPGIICQRWQGSLESVY
jgi:hypothetical protein